MGFKPIPECAIIDSWGRDQRKICDSTIDFKWRVVVHFGEYAAKKIMIYLKNALNKSYSELNFQKKLSGPLSVSLSGEEAGVSKDCYFWNTFYCIGIEK